VTSKKRTRGKEGRLPPPKKTTQWGKGKGKMGTQGKGKAVQKDQGKPEGKGKPSGPAAKASSHAGPSGHNTRLTRSTSKRGAPTTIKSIGRTGIYGGPSDMEERDPTESERE